MSSLDAGMRNVHNIIEYWYTVPWSYYALICSSVREGIALSENGLSPYSGDVFHEVRADLKSARSTLIHAPDVRRPLSFWHCSPPSTVLASGPLESSI